MFLACLHLLHFGRSVFDQLHDRDLLLVEYRRRIKYHEIIGKRRRVFDMCLHILHCLFIIMQRMF